MFQSGQSQAVRLPKEFRFNGTDWIKISVYISSKDGRINY